MSRLRLFLILTVLTCTLLAPFAAAQGALPFTIRVQQAGTVTEIGSGGTIVMAAGAIGVPATASVTLTYSGAEATTLSGIARTGSLDFSVSGSAPPFALATGNSFTVGVQYLPSTSATAAGVITFTYTDGALTPTFTINLTGTAPEFAFSYTPAGGNATQVSPGAVLSFADTAVGSTTTATVVLTNRGTATGVVNSVRPAGAAFRVSGLPLLQAEVAAGGQFSFTVSFTPDRLNDISGSLAIGFVSRTETFVLQGVGLGAQYAYEIVQDSSVTSVVPGQPIELPDALVSETSSIVVRVRNTGNADGQISTISASGTGFQLTGLPFLPATVVPGGSFLFTIKFSPAEVGRLSGRLKIGDQSFDLAGNGLGALLKYSATIGTVTTAVADKGTVILPQAAIGASSSAVFSITNSGTSQAAINSISLAKSTAIFTLSGVPALPLTLDAGASTSFTIRFAPSVAGSATETLRIDGASFTVSGTGSPPPPLPAYRFEGSSGIQQPRQQPAIGLTLNFPYSLPLTGTLKLEFNSDVFSNDPAVQFATGGRTVAFTIPANSTQAVFPGSATQIRLQTGTVAGTITVTPSFATAGGDDLTPDTPLAMTMSVAQSAPVVLSVAISSRNPAALTLQVTGFSTTRSVTKMDLQFTPIAGESVATTSLSLNTEAAFTAWYQSSQSTQYGSQFTASIPLQFKGDVNKVSNAVSTVGAISVTMTNSQGTSAAQSVTVPDL